MPVSSELCCSAKQSLLCTDQWDAQSTVIRINDSLIERGYVTWFDLTHMKGKHLLPASCGCSVSTIANKEGARVYIVHCASFRKHNGRDERGGRRSCRDAVRRELEV